MASSNINHLSQPSIYGDFASSYAGRKSRLMKWLLKLFKSGGGGSNRAGASSGGGGQNPQFHGEENMVLRAPARSLDDRSRVDQEKEELDHAVALSLAEDLKRSSVSKTVHDMSLARICGGCNQDIGYGNYLGCMGTFFHPQCFRCRACGYPITEHEFSLSGRDAYHKSCFKELTHPKCEVCYQFIPTNGAGLIEYRCHPFWSQKYCPSHEHDNTARCCSCERLESWNARYVPLGDGRSLCLECMESAIMDTGDCQPLYHAIRDYYEGMNMKLDQQIPMLLVERQALNEAIIGEKSGHHHMPETRGLCLSEEQTVTGILKRPQMGSHGLVRTPQKLTRKCEVTAILVLYGLPRLLTGAILAHELMHGWLRLKGIVAIKTVLEITEIHSLICPIKLVGYRNLNPEVEEGICQVLSYMWLESEVPGFKSMPSLSGASSSSSSSSKKGGKSEAEKKLGEFFMHQIVHDVSPAYGGGFRAANAAVNRYGLRRTLDHIQLTGSFPV
ncbi:Zinc finger, LIM-type [Dillenia turbinata]|uniref:Zinc finger, LIM-type n=1 Tax=Dillenia turbinata TaxID=194707 RepID=A0AAN8VF44_9MAGN